MAFEIIVPRLGWTMEEGVFRGWLRKDGEDVRAGDLLFVLESDKAMQEVEAVDAGILRIAPGGPAEGETVKVGAVLGWLLGAGEEPPAIVSGGAAAGAAVSPEAAPAAGAPAPARSAEAPGGPRDLPAISPRALRVAGELGVDWKKLRGSGRSGRIAERDVRAAAGAGSARRQAPAVPEPVEDGRVRPFSPIRRATAEAVIRSARSVVPVTLLTEADATELTARREGGKGETFGITAAFIRIASLALAGHPRLASAYTEAGIVEPRGIHVAFAVEVDDGLLAPVVRDVDRKTLAAIDAEVRALAAKCREGRASAAELSGGVFTITNLGSCDVDGFTPVVPAGQGAILGIGRIADRPAVREGLVVPRKLVTLSLTFDHRVVDGAPAGRFLARIRKLVEDPGGL